MALVGPWVQAPRFLADAVATAATCVVAWFVIGVSCGTCIGAIAQAISHNSLRFGDLAFALRASALRQYGRHASGAADSGLALPLIDGKGL